MRIFLSLCWTGLKRHKRNKVEQWPTLTEIEEHHFSNCTDIMNDKQPILPVPRGSL